MINASDSNGTFYILNQNQGTPIIFIHGVGLNHKIWKPQFDVFENTIVAYDILGHGQTPLESSNLSFDNFSRQLLNLIDELNFKKIHLVGFSIGSLIARNFAENYNNRLESLTLLCSIFKRSKEQQQIVNDRFELSKKSRSLSKQALKRWFTDEYILQNPKIYEEISSMLNENNMEDFLKIYELFVKHKDNEKFENIKVKTLIMTGEFDSGSTPEMSKNLSKCIKNSKVKIIKNGKHLCSIECADEVNHEIKLHVN
ncbi:alpha/beta hydrolase [Pelagibacterales bacterium SAG-MED15]|nr:alpha/beta hydrolase [Pelagibacterales bacterium SAG-MED15]